MISIFSPFKSATTAFTLSPFTPTQAPTASTFSSFDHTAIFDLEPASLQKLLISTTPSAISVTSFSNSLFTSSGCVLETTIFGPLFVFLTSVTYSLILSPLSYVSPSIISDGFKSASVLSSRLTFTLSPTCLSTIPVTTSFSFIWK